MLVLGFMLMFWFRLGIHFVFVCAFLRFCFMLCLYLGFVFSFALGSSLVWDLGLILRFMLVFGFG